MAALGTASVRSKEREAVAFGETGWTTKDAKTMYLVDRWGSGYFEISDNGDMTVLPLMGRGGKIVIREVVEAAREKGLGCPLLIRFQDMLHHRVRALNEAFNAAISRKRFKGVYRGVFPIKVNQLREVVEEITGAGRPFHYGLEVGSKPELFAGLSLHTDNESLIICNGYKDDNYIRAALLGRKLGKIVILVAEKLSEVQAIVDVAKEVGAQPMIGVRLRLASKGAGKWSESSGGGAKFGLSTEELLSAIAILREAGMSNALKLAHFHIGSQVPDILIIKRAIREATRYYAKLRKMGLPIEYLDVGGGLAIDYDGSRTTSNSSMNYSVREYARDIVSNVADVCDEESVPHPNLVSESGRAVVAHHSVLVVEALNTVEKPGKAPANFSCEEHKLLRELREIGEMVEQRELTESWHDLVQIREEAQKMFEVGLLDLELKAKTESLFWEVAQRILRLASQLNVNDLPEEMIELRRELADQYICNFSVFQSLLDHWALGAMFPVLPIHRLNERPTARARLADITCDSDGKISKYIHQVYDEDDTLPLHPVNDKPYYLGVFLTGAYQDIMGDLHNLFGRVNEVHVFLDTDEPCGYYLEVVIPGSSISEVLGMVQYDAREMTARVKAQVDAAIKQDRLKPSEGMKLLEDYEKGLKDSTYLHSK
jgi:arginine decarboxylase